jgi:hypothetical protein
VHGSVQDAAHLQGSISFINYYPNEGWMSGGRGAQRILSGGVKEIYKLRRQKWTEEPVTGQYERQQRRKREMVRVLN